MSFELARKIADAVLYEGYMLYPYRASSVKNRVRWQFGVVMPRGYSEAGGSEPWTMQTECLVEAQGEPVLQARCRFLQLRSRAVEEAVGEGFRPAESLELEGRTLVTWDEGLERELDPPAIPLLELLGQERAFPLAADGGREVEVLQDRDGRLRGRVVRQHWPLSGVMRVSAEALGSLVKVRIRIENLSPWASQGEPNRDQALRLAMVGTHTLLGLDGGWFVSLLDPPWWAAEAAASCENQRTWPVLVGPEGRRDVMLSSPIILYDYPAVAPESPGDLCDSTEIDEILTLRVMTMTEDEKREARATDDRARRIVDRADTMPPEVLERLHGAIRSLGTVPPEMPAELSAWESFLNPSSTVPPGEAFLEIGSRRVAKGSRVRLCPSRRADSMDAFLEGRVARVEGIYGDVDEQTHVAVTLEDDPAGELQGWIGRFFYFAPDEVEPLDPADGTEEEGRR